MAVRDPMPSRRPAVGALAEMSPAYFGLVMATGVVSLASFSMDHTLIASGLFYLNVAQFLILWVLYILRAALHPRRFFGDMVGHLTGPGYFTAVAGTGILASQYMVQRENLAVGAGLWLLAVGLWIGLTYTIFTAFTIKVAIARCRRAASTSSTYGFGSCRTWIAGAAAPSVRRARPTAESTRTSNATG